MLSFTYNFLQGINESLLANLNGIWNFVKHPIKGTKELGEGVAFLGEAVIPGTEASKALRLLVSQLVSDFTSADANERSKQIGKVTGEVLLAIVSTKGIGELKNLLQDSSKASKIAKLVDMAEDGNLDAKVIEETLEGAGNPKVI